MSKEKLQHWWSWSQEFYTTDLDLRFYEFLAPLVALFKYEDNVFFSSLSKPSSFEFLKSSVKIFKVLCAKLAANALTF